MKYRKLDENDDFVFGHNKQDYLLDSKAVAQAIYTRIKLLKNEWWEDLEDGTPLFQKVLGSKITPNTKNAVDLIMRDRILNTPDVETILGYKSEVDTVNRVYSMVCSVQTKYGVIEDFTVTI